MTMTMTPDLASSLVEELYGALLDRQADATGLADKASRLVSGEASFRLIVSEIVGSLEFARRMPIVLKNNLQEGVVRFTNDVSQYGEIWMLIRHWVNEQACCGVVVDVGARGKDRSNSYDLMRHFGWKGLLVEANPSLIPSIQRDFRDVNLQLVCCAVSDFDGQATFTIGVNDDVSSLDPLAAAVWGETNGSVDVEVRRLGGLLSEHDIPHEFDLLSLDIEGEDIKVLNDLVERSAYRPRWIIIEASYDFKVKELADLGLSSQVRSAYYLHAATSANLILALRHPEREEWRSLNAKAFGTLDVARD